MAEPAQAILEHLATVERERLRRQGEPAWGAAVPGLKAYQQQRFRKTYADLLAHPRYAAAARFFLDELYGPRDFTQRDREFARIVPALVRLFPPDVVRTVELLAALHALSETLDSAMALACPPQTPWDAEVYRQCWRTSGQPEARERQIALTLQVGRSLDRFTRAPLLRHSLKLMRGPARAAGLSALQTFLESGFDAFAAMRGADEFLGTIGQRERALAAALFLAPGQDPVADGTDVLGQLP